MFYSDASFTNMIFLGKLMTLIAVSVVRSEGLSQDDDVLPVMVFDEGDTALVPCIKEANDNDFFWSKGKWYDNGTNIAYLARGIPSKSNKYDVHIDGTLVIRDISLADEGNYFCRFLSESTESYVGVRIYVRVSAEALDIAIEGCTSSSSCVKVLEPSLESQLTCTANMISESMTLKWYNGTKEIFGDVDVPESLRQKIKITNVIRFVYQDESQLTCQAEGVNIAKNMAVIQLKKKKVENEATTTLLVPTMVLGIICLILTGILICVIVCYWKLKKEKGKTKDSHSLEMSDDKKKDQKPENCPLVTSKEENDTDLATKERDLQRLQEEINKKDEELMEKEKKVKKLQTEMKDTKKALEKNKGKLVKAERDLKQRENEEEQLRGTDKQNATADITIANLQRELQDTKKQLTTAQNAEKKLQEDLKGADAKHSLCENTIKELQKDLQEERTKLSKCEDTKQSIPTVIIGVKGVLSKGQCNYEDVMPKSKYDNVSLVSGPSYQTHIFAKIKDKVEKTCLSGTDTYMFVFGSVESKLHHTLHGEKDNNGLIEMVAHVIFSSSNQLQENGFQVNIKVSIASIALDGKVKRFRGPPLPAEGTDKMKLRSGVDITLYTYSAQSEQSLLKIVSFMTPNKDSPRDHGLLKITVEILMEKTTVSKGIIFIASIINIMKISKVFKGNADDSFEEVLSLLTRNSKGDLVLIPNVDPDLECEPRRTFEAVKKTLDAYCRLHT